MWEVDNVQKVFSVPFLTDRDITEYRKTKEIVRDVPTISFALAEIKYVVAYTGVCNDETRFRYAKVHITDQVYVDIIESQEARDALRGTAWKNMFGVDE